MLHESQAGQDNGLDHLQGLGHEEQVALVVSIGDGASVDGEQQDRSVFGGGEQADGETAVGEVQHQEGQSHVGQPVAGVGHELADEEQPKIAGSQRRERAPPLSATRNLTGTETCTRRSCPPGPRFGSVQLTLGQPVEQVDGLGEDPILIWLDNGVDGFGQPGLA